MHQELRRKIPQYLTYVRFIVAPILIILGFLQLKNWYIIIGFPAGLTDMMDGYLARKWRVESVEGALRDAQADDIFMSAVIIGFIFLAAEILVPYLMIFSLVISFFLISRFILFVKGRKVVCKHLWSGKLSTLFFSLAIVYTVIIGEITFAFWFGLGMGVLTMTEQFLVTLLYENVHPDTHSIFRMRFL